MHKLQCLNIQKNDNLFSLKINLINYRMSEDYSIALTSEKENVLSLSLEFKKFMFFKFEECDNLIFEEI
jgi:hypothetical protein